jgi:hypothetical protein
VLRQPPQTPGSSDFLPELLPKEASQRSEKSHLLVKGINWASRLGCKTCLPSWSCGFDSRRPLQLISFFDLLFIQLQGEAVYWSSWHPDQYLPCSNLPFEQIHGNVRAWLDSPLFYPKVHEP